MTFEIVPGDAASPYIVHVPHSSTTIPGDVRARLVLDDDALAEELRLMTDAHTEELAILVDLHSYPVRALPYERHQDARRPPVCIGVDDDHTPAALLERVSRACSTIGQVVVNEPFAGTYVPLRHLGRDSRVASVMVELRRDMYLRDDGRLDPAGAHQISLALAAIVGG